MKIGEQISGVENKIEDENRKIIDEMIKGIKFSAYFLEMGDFILSLAEDSDLLAPAMKNLVTDFLKKNKPNDKLEEDRIEELCVSMIEIFPHIVEEMKKETEDNMVRRFNSFYYDSLPDKNGKRRIVLTEPSAYRIRQGDANIIIKEFMSSFLEKSPIRKEMGNKYNFSEKNLEFLFPKLSELVDKLLANYKEQTREE